MRKSIADIVESVADSKPQFQRARSITDLLAPIEALVVESPNLVRDHKQCFETETDSYLLPRYLFIGPQGGDTPIRIGIFAGIHGDEPEGADAIVRFIRYLESYPEIARGYALSFYPVCNPTGFEDNTRHSRRGRDLNREFWRDSVEPEVGLLQAEIISHSFQGIISLHADDTSEGFYGFVRGATLGRHLIEPALKAAEQFLPRDARPSIDGFQACNGIVRKSYAGVLSAPPNARPRPFEIILETPSAPPTFVKECALVAALQTILVEYRRFMAYAPNL
jgi:hypothetical protein